MDNNAINTLNEGERVTSTYADIYFDDEYCDFKKIIKSDSGNELAVKKCLDKTVESVWISPSDLLTDIIELKPPFTSKITRGITHEGILAIGEELLAGERAKFVTYLTKLINDNDSAWSHILSHEMAAVVQNVNDVYGKIFINKSDVMTKEISKFYEDSLCELEIFLKSEVQNVLISTHANTISKLNTEIENKLKKEKKVLDEVLKKRHASEVAKIRKYYRLLLNNELLRNNELIIKYITERNDALKAFYQQIDSQNICSTMYVMCTERKKCKIKKFILDNYQNIELMEKIQKIKNKQDVIDSLKKKDVQISQINKEWEDKIKKILKLFLKFISFSLKLLPEQSSFLLEFEKMVVLQINELQKMPCKNMVSPILIDEEKIQNIFEFIEREKENDECIKEPFVIEGDLLPTPSPSYGSRETLPEDVDLRTVRLARQFVYAKCHHYEEIKALLDAERCKCLDFSVNQHSESSEPQDDDQGNVPVESIDSESSYETLIIDDVHRLKECPVRNCKGWATKSTFPNLESYLDFDEEKYNQVLAILGNLPKRRDAPSFIDPKDILYKELPFGRTKETHHTVETQYSSQEDVSMPDMKCTCVDNFIPNKQPSTYRLTESQSKTILSNIAKRRISLRRLLNQNPNLMKMFTDESFDLQFLD